MDELRDKYLQGKLSEEERKAFEENLSSEERKELATELGIGRGLEGGFRKELKDKVASFENKRNKSRSINYTYIGVAASLILVASLVFIFSKEEQSLFDQYYQPYPNYEVTAVRGEEDPDLRESAYLAYDKQDYENALRTFNSMDELSEPDYFFRGICLLETGYNEGALSDFEKVISAQNKDYAYPSKWLSALIYLRMDEETLAKQFLESLINDDSEYSEKAIEILGKL